VDVLERRYQEARAVLARLEQQRTPLQRELATLEADKNQGEGGEWLGGWRRGVCGDGDGGYITAVRGAGAAIGVSQRGLCLGGNTALLG
jgi:hypothetical protein